MDVLSRPAEEFGNDESVEAMWAMRAFDHAEVYFNLLCSVDPRLLKLTPYDDQIYQAFREEFPSFNVAKMTENELKNPSAKQKWRSFIEKFNKLDDYSYGTLMRADASQDFGPHNSILVVRIQFWAIEIARNREGHNDKIRYKYKPTPAQDDNEGGEEQQ
ncbi:protein PBDC1 [Sitodiplosis mosellana]|uniref:protein PBDC1 n=1 Tax=Sitodiplosis mosellana TaxID=263140 RepID=UPI002444C69B|nr:protein PBDC1 [Sitodiplosis mosellana]